MLLYPRSLRRRVNSVHAFWMPLAPSMSMLSSSSQINRVKKKRIEKLETRRTSQSPQACVQSSTVSPFRLRHPESQANSLERESPRRVVQSHREKRAKVLKLQQQQQLLSSNLKKLLFASATLDREFVAIPRRLRRAAHRPWAPTSCPPQIPRWQSRNSRAGRKRYPHCRCSLARSDHHDRGAAPIQRRSRCPSQ